MFAFHSDFNKFVQGNKLYFCLFTVHSFQELKASLFCKSAINIQIEMNIKASFTIETFKYVI